MATWFDLIEQSFWVGKSFNSLCVQTVFPAAAPFCFLFDNGSLRAEATLSLRRAAQGLAGRLGRPVGAVSLLHSSGVAAEALGGEPARLLETALVDYFKANPEGDVVLAPLFFGPSAALTDYVPERVKAVKAKFPSAVVRLAPPLVNIADQDDLRVATMLADQVRATAQSKNWKRPKVVLVDHGSPQPVVTAVRNHLAGQLRVVLDGEIAALTAASMERRPGDTYAFNEPLLATALRTPPFNDGEVIVALQFLAPGRHAGPEGDVAQICSAAKIDFAGLTTAMTEPIGQDPRLAELLAERIGQAAVL
jgi:sirohydrochlorin ferrochelatase